MEKNAVPNPAFQTTSICFRLSQIPLHNMTQYALSGPNGSRVGHHVLFRSFFFEFLATYETQKKVSFFSVLL